jgi:hypothetical protein
MNEDKTVSIGTMHQCQLKQQLKRSVLLRPVVRKLGVLSREVAFIRDIVRSGRLFVYHRNLVSSRQLPSQKVITYAISLPPLRNFHDLIAWVNENDIRHQEGGFCIYVPPQEKVKKLFGSILGAYPPDAGLKILKDLRAPSEAMYCSTDVNPDSPRISDWIGYRPLDYLRVANYLYDKGVGPRVYDLIEVQTPHNRLSIYVVHHIAGTVPSVGECTAFLERLSRLCEDQLIPMMSKWKTSEDFLPPDCRGNLIRDEATGKTLYVDFQAFMIKDAKQYALQVANEIREDVHFGNPHWIRGGKYFYQSIPGLRIGKRETDVRWNVFKQALQRQGVSIEGALVFDIGCNAGMILYAALTDGAARGVGWDRPSVAAAARKLLLSLGATRFDILGQEISSNTDFHSTLPRYVNSDGDSILFFLSMRKHIGFPDSVKNLPFKYMVYEDHYGEKMSDVKNYLKEIEHNWGLRIDNVASYVDGDGGTEHVFAILHRD